MSSRLSYTTAALAALMPLATAQTYSSCNPTDSSQFPCPADEGLCQSTVFETDFTTGDNSSWHSLAGTVSYTDAGAEFTIAQRGDAPTIETDFYIFYGKVEVTMKSAPGTGIVSSIVLESNDLDEIDWEFLGGEDTLVQSNYFGKGNTTTYDREAEHAVATPEETSHTYTIDWTASQIVWSIDGTAVRTLDYADAVSGTNFPQTPSTLRLGIWAGGDEDNSYWTRVWAGGNTTYSAAAGMPWTMTVEKVRITNYNPATSYNYTDTTGSSDSIALIGTTCESNGTATTTAAAAATTKATTTTGSESSSSSSISSSISSSSSSSSSTGMAASAVAVSTPGSSGASTPTLTPTPSPTPSSSSSSGGVGRVSAGLREFLFGSFFVALLLL